MPPPTMTTAGAFCAFCPQFVYSGLRHPAFVRTDVDKDWTSAKLASGGTLRLSHPRRGSRSADPWTGHPSPPGLGDAARDPRRRSPSASCALPRGPRHAVVTPVVRAPRRLPRVLALPCSCTTTSCFDDAAGVAANPRSTRPTARPSPCSPATPDRRGLSKSVARRRRTSTSPVSCGASPTRSARARASSGQAWECEPSVALTRYHRANGHAVRGGVRAGAIASNRPEEPGPPSVPSSVRPTRSLTTTTPRRGRSWQTEQSRRAPGDPTRCSRSVCPTPSATPAPARRGLRCCAALRQPAPIGTWLAAVAQRLQPTRVDKHAANSLAAMESEPVASPLELALASHSSQTSRDGSSPGTQ